MRPPRLGTWLLSRFVGSEALAGDLAEEFQGGRSAAWYWRQVLIAVAQNSYQSFARSNMRFSARKMSLPFVTAIVAAFLGFVMLLSGLGLLIAVLSTRQSSWQPVTALVLMLAGGINLWVSRSLSRAETRAIVMGATATILLTVYLAFSQSGELIAYDQLYLLLLFALAYRRHDGAAVRAIA